MSIVIATDTPANLPDSLVNSCSLTVLPFTYIIEGEANQCLSLDGFDDEQFYSLLKNPLIKSGTSLINTSTYIEAFESILSAGNDLIYMAMSSGISGSFNASHEAVEQLRDKFPQRKMLAFDTRGASLGEGFQVLAAAKLRDSGASFEDIVACLEDCRLKMKQVFTVDDLMYLKRGGRVGAVTAVLGTVLQIKPILVGDENGRIIVSGKARGRKASIVTLAESLFENIDPARVDSIGIAHAGCAQDAKALAELISERFPKAEILTVKYEPVTGLHVGPGALALFYFSK